MNGKLWGLSVAVAFAAATAGSCSAAGAGASAFGAFGADAGAFAAAAAAAAVDAASAVFAAVAGGVAGVAGGGGGGGGGGGSGGGAAAAAAAGAAATTTRALGIVLASSVFSLATVGSQCQKQLLLWGVLIVFFLLPAVGQFSLAVIAWCSCSCFCKGCRLSERNLRRGCLQHRGHSCGGKSGA